MKKRFWTGLVAALAIFAMAVPCVMADDIELAKKSTLEEIVQRGELRVGFEAGYLPFEMADKNGNFVGFDIDMAKAMADAGADAIVVETMSDPAELTVGVRVAIVSGGLRAALLPLAAHLGVPDADVHAVEIVAAPAAIRRSALRRCRA